MDRDTHFSYKISSLINLNFYRGIETLIDHLKNSGKVDMALY